MMIDGRQREVEMERSKCFASSNAIQLLAEDRFSKEKNKNDYLDFHIITQVIKP